MKPIPLKNFVPPTTNAFGMGGVFANRHDSSGLFPSRPRTHSAAKRSRLEREQQDGDQDGIERVFDLDEPYPPLVVPERPGLNVSAISEALIEAGPKVAAVKKVLEDDDKDKTKKKKLDETTKSIGELCILLYTILEAVCEKGIKPLAAGTTATSGGGGTRNQRPQLTEEEKKEEKNKRDLKKLLESADKSTVIFNADLGTVPTMNKDKLNNNFSKAVAEATTRQATVKKMDKEESIAMVQDVLDCSKGISFLGQTTKQYTNDRDPSDPLLIKKFQTMPVKLEFENRNIRFNCERILKERGGLKVAQSIPKQIKNIYGEFSKKTREEHPDLWVMIRIDPAKLCLRAMVKDPADRVWSDVGTLSIPPSVMENERDRQQVAAGSNAAGMDIGTFSYS